MSEGFPGISGNRGQKIILIKAKASHAQFLILMQKNDGKFIAVKDDRYVF